VDKFEIGYGTVENSRQ